MKRLNVTFEIENDLAEDKLRSILNSMGAKYIRTLPNTDHLKDNPSYIKLVKAKADAQLILDRYTNENR